MLSIYTNLGALRPLRRLGEATSALSQSSERLATGIRINRASDDAAGLSIAASLNAKARINTQAIRNVNDGISYLNVADGATGELKNILIRLRELSTQSSNGTISNGQRRSLDKEAQALQTEYNRIIDTTTFNGLVVFGGSVSVQAGDDNNAGIVVGASASGKLVGDGTFQDAVSLGTGAKPIYVAAADLNGDGVLDLVTVEEQSDTASVFLGNGDGTFQARISFATGNNPWDAAVADLNGDGVLDLVTMDDYGDTASVFLGNGDGTFQARTSFATGDYTSSVEAVDLNGDGILDLVKTDYGDNKVSVFLGNGDGTFQARASFATGTHPWFLTPADLNGDGVVDLVTGDYDDNTVSVLLGNGDGTFQARTSLATTGSDTYSVATADLNGDEILDLVVACRDGVDIFLGNGDGTFQARTNFTVGGNSWFATTADLNGDGFSDLVVADDYETVGVFLGNGDGTFQARTGFATGKDPWIIVAADLNGDGVLDLVTPDYSSSTVSVLLGNGVPKSGLTPLSGVNVATRASALSAQGQIDDYFDELNSVSGSIGVGLSRLSAAMSNLQTTVEGVKAAESRIMDVDTAEEATRLVSTKILQQAASGVLAHALKGPELVLTLLQAPK